MNATLLFRIVAIVLVLFAAGHTFGFLNFSPATPEGRAVFDAMNSVHFPAHGEMFSYGKFYRGFGLFISIYLVFSAFLAWWLGQVARTQPKTTVPMTWAFAATQAVGVVLSVLYFSLLPALFSASAAAGLIWAACLL
jgi:hypothetical protein